MDPYANILNNIQEVQYLLRKMRNEINCCLKATSTVKTRFRDLATALAEEEFEKLNTAALDESAPTDVESTSVSVILLSQKFDAVEEADDGDSSLDVITEAGLVKSAILNFTQEVTFNSLSFDYGAVILKMNERVDLSGSLGFQVFSCDLDSSSSFRISGVCQNVYKKFIAPSVTIYHLSDYTDLLWLLNGVPFQLFWKDKPPRPPEIISFPILYKGVSTIFEDDVHFSYDKSLLMPLSHFMNLMRLSTVSCFITQTQMEKGTTGCLIDSFMRGILSIVSKNSVAPVQCVKFFIFNQDEMLMVGDLCEPYYGITDCFAKTVKDEGFVTLSRSDEAVKDEFQFLFEEARMLVMHSGWSLDQTVPQRFLFRNHEWLRSRSAINVESKKPTLYVGEKEFTVKELSFMILVMLPRIAEAYLRRYFIYKPIADVTAYTLTEKDDIFDIKENSKDTHVNGRERSVSRLTVLYLLRVSGSEVVKHLTFTDSIIDYYDHIIFTTQANVIKQTLMLFESQGACWRIDFLAGSDAFHDIVSVILVKQMASEFCLWGKPWICTRLTPSVGVLKHYLNLSDHIDLHLDGQVAAQAHQLSLYISNTFFIILLNLVVMGMGIKSISDVSNCLTTKLEFIKYVEELILEYLSFVKGSVNSEELSLKFSRAMLEPNKICKHVTYMGDVFDEYDTDQLKEYEVTNIFSATEMEKKKKKIKVFHEWSLVNKHTHIWMRKLEEIIKDAYAAVYKSLTLKHIFVEAQLDFKFILFVRKPMLFALFVPKKKGHEVLVMVDKRDDPKSFRKLTYQFPQCSCVHLWTLIPSSSRESRETIDLIKLLYNWDWDSSKGPSTSEILGHILIPSCYCNPPSMWCRALLSVPSISKREPAFCLKPRSLDDLVRLMSQKKIAIKVLVLNHNFISVISNWIAAEVLASKGITILFLAEFRQVTYHELQYRELSLHMYDPWDAQLLVRWSEHPPDATTWKMIASIRHEFPTFDRFREGE